MATIDQITLCKRALELAVAITAQGKAFVVAQYSGPNDLFDVYAFTDSVKGQVDASKIESVPGWESCAHTIWLGDAPCSGLDPIAQLERLIDDMKKLLDVDADGVPV